MKMNNDLSLDPVPSHADSSAVVGLTPPPTRPGPGVFSQNGSATNGLSHGGEGGASSIDPWSLAEAVAKRWYWILLGGLLLAVLGATAGITLWQTSYTATAQLIRYDSPTATEVLGDRAISLHTFADLLRTPELVQRVSAASSPPMAPDALASNLRVVPERNSETLTISMSALAPETAADLANLYAREAVEFTREMQAKEAASISQHLQQQLANIDSQVRQLDQQLRQISEQNLQMDQEARAFDQQFRQIDQQLRQLGQETFRAAPDGQPSGPGDSLSIMMRAAWMEQLRAAQQELVSLLGQYTEANPLVQAQRLKLASLEAQLADNLAALPSGALPNQVASSQPALPRLPPTGLTNTTPVKGVAREIDPDVARNRLGSLDTVRLPLASRLRVLQSFADNPPGQLRVLIPAKPQSVLKHGREVKVASLGAFGLLLGMAGAGFLVLLVEVTDRRLKNADDVRRVARLPVIAALGQLNRMSQSTRERWAFQAWTALQARLTSSPNNAVVCGVISSSSGEGCSTWVDLLAQAASQRGFRVLTVTIGSGGDNAGHDASISMTARGDMSASCGGGGVSNVLACPGDVARKLIGSSPQVMVHISLPGWSWNLERRRQWQAALEHWRTIDNIAILVKLPPASEPEAILLAEELPNLLWVTDSGRADAATTRTQLQTLRNGRCNLVGAALNHAPSHPLKKRFSRWLAN